MGAKIILPDNVVQEIIKDYEKGVYYDEMLLKYKLSKNLLYRILTDNNVPRRFYNKIVLPDPLVKAVIEDYQLGIEQCELTLKHGINEYFVRRILHDNDILIRDRVKTIPEDVKQSILNDYRLGLGFKRIRQKYNVPQNPLDKLLTENGIIRHPRHGNGATRHEFNYNFFNEDTPMAAYWAGFIMADGCISKPTSATQGACYRLSISLNKLDAAHLQQFLIDIEYCMASMPLVPSLLNQQVRATVTHPLLISSLERWGVVPRKSHNFVEPNIPEQLLRHYLLGWFDGDGSLCLTEKTKSLSITGNSIALGWYFKALQTIGYDGKFSFWQPKGKTWSRMSISCMPRIMKITNLFFPEPTFCLYRKWNKVLEIQKKSTLPVLKQ